MASVRSALDGGRGIERMRRLRRTPENAPAIVASVFGEVEVEPWDDQLVELRDGVELHRYLIQHLADPNLADHVAVPLRLTKRGCLVWARK
jgi:hypothetical protein